MTACAFVPLSIIVIVGPFLGIGAGRMRQRPAMGSHIRRVRSVDPSPAELASNVVLRVIDVVDVICLFTGLTILAKHEGLAAICGINPHAAASFLVAASDDGWAGLPDCGRTEQLPATLSNDSVCSEREAARWSSRQQAPAALDKDLRAGDDVGIARVFQHVMRNASDGGNEQHTGRHHG